MEKLYDIEWIDNENKYCQETGLTKKEAKKRGKELEEKFVLYFSCTQRVA